MTPYRHFSRNSTWPNRLRRGGLYAAVAALLTTHAASCGGGDNSDWEEVTTYEVTKGVITTLEETEPGQYSIIDEKVVEGRDASRVIINRLNGTVDTLNLDQAKGMVQAQDTVYRDTHRSHGMGMGGILWWGAMGYMMGRGFGSPSPSNIYRPGFTSRAGQELRQTAIPRTELRPAKGRSGFFKGSRSTTGS